MTYHHQQRRPLVAYTKDDERHAVTIIHLAEHRADEIIAQARREARRIVMDAERRSALIREKAHTEGLARADAEVLRRERIRKARIERRAFQAAATHYPLAG